MKKALLSAFNESIERGKSEEIGSIDIIEVAGQTYFVNKTGRDTYALFEEDSMTPLAEKSTSRKNSFNMKERAVLSELFRRLCYFHKGDINARCLLLARPSEVKCLAPYGLIRTDSVETLRLKNCWYVLTAKGKEYFAPMTRPMDATENLDIFEGRLIMHFPYIVD